MVDPTYWPYLTVAVALTVTVWAANRRAMTTRRSFGQRRCLGCGYDLSQSPDRCPECGRPTPRRLDPDKLRRPPPFGQVVQPADVTGQPLDHVVHQTPDQTEARLLVLQLNIRGIPAGRTDGRFPGHRLLVLHRVSVRSADADAAADVVGALE